MKTINIRESLLNIDRHTNCKYDLTSLYESIKLNEEQKKKLVKYLDGPTNPEDIGKFINSCSGDCPTSVCEDYYNDDLEDGYESEWKELKSKQVPDSDGFLTDYTMYWKSELDGSGTKFYDRFVFVFGDKDIYKPEDENFDWECETEKEADKWFDNYKGFIDEDDSNDYDYSMFDNIEEDLYVHEVAISQEDALQFLNRLPQDTLGKTFYEYNTDDVDELSYIISDEDLIKLGYKNSLKSTGECLKESTDIETAFAEFKQVSTDFNKFKKNKKMFMKLRGEWLDKLDRLYSALPHNTQVEGRALGKCIFDLEQVIKWYAYRYYNNLTIDTLKESVNTEDIFAEITNKVNDYLHNELGYEKDFIDDYVFVEVITEDNGSIKVEVRAELDYTELENLATELNKVIEVFDKDAYFEPAEPGIIDAYIFNNAISEALNDSKDAEKIYSAVLYDIKDRNDFMSRIEEIYDLMPEDQGFNFIYDDSNQTFLTKNHDGSLTQVDVHHRHWTEPYIIPANNAVRALLDSVPGARVETLHKVDPATHNLNHYYLGGLVVQRNGRGVYRTSNPYSKYLPNKSLKEEKDSFGQDIYDDMFEDIQPQKIATDSKGNYLVKADSGKGFSAFNKDGVAIGGINSDNPNSDLETAKQKFMSGNLDEEVKLKEATGTLDKPLSKKKGTLGNVLANHADEVAMVRNIPQAMELLNKIEPEVRDKSYVEKVREILRKERRQGNALKLLYNIILKGDGAGLHEEMNKFSITDTNGDIIDTFDSKVEAEKWVSQLIKDGDYSEDELQIIDSDLHSKTEKKRTNI